MDNHLGKASKDEPAWLLYTRGSNRHTRRVSTHARPEQPLHRNQSGLELVPGPEGLVTDVLANSPLRTHE